MKVHFFLRKFPSTHDPQPRQKQLNSEQVNNITGTLSPYHLKVCHTALDTDHYVISLFFYNAKINETMIFENIFMKKKEGPQMF